MQEIEIVVKDKMMFGYIMSQKASFGSALWSLS